MIDVDGFHANAISAVVISVVDVMLERGRTIIVQARACNVPGQTESKKTGPVEAHLHWPGANAIPLIPSYPCDPRNAVLDRDDLAD
jgi:hypothetical protein